MRLSKTSLARKATPLFNGQVVVKVGRRVAPTLHIRVDHTLDKGTVEHYRAPRTMYRFMMQVEVNWRKRRCNPDWELVLLLW